MSIATKGAYLNETKLLLRDAIRRAGHYLADNATFRSYPYAMLADESSLTLDFEREEYIAKNWRDGTVSRIGFANIINFTRASGGGRFNHLGVYEWLAANTPRIDHDPATVSLSSTPNELIGNGVRTFTVTRQYTVGHYVRATADAANWMGGRVLSSSATSVTLWIDKVVGAGTFSSWTLIRKLGLLVEESRTNTLTFSNSFTNAAWSRTGCEVEAYGTGWKCTTTAATAIFNRAVLAATGSATLTASFKLKRGDHDWVRVVVASGLAFANGAYGYFNLNTGEKGSAVPVGSATGVSSSMTPTEDGYYICSVSATVAGATSGTAACAGCTADGVTARPSAGAYFLLRDAQLETGAFPTSHIPTTDAQVTRSADQSLVENLLDWLGSEKTIIIEHDAVAGRPLLSSNSVTLAASQGAGKIAISYTGSGISICQNGGPITSSTALAFGSSVKLMATVSSWANAHLKKMTSIPRALSATELQRITSL